MDLPAEPSVAPDDTEPAVAPGGGSRAWIGRRTFIGGGLSLAALAVCGIYPWQLEPHWLEIVRRPLPIGGLPAVLDGSLLVHFSDLHVGPDVSDAYVLHTFDRIAALKPDIVTVTGDFTTYEEGIVDHAQRIYAQMPRGRLATLGVLGNHDYGLLWQDHQNATRVARALTEVGVTVLRDKAVAVSGLQIVGLDDLWASGFHPEKAFAEVEQGGAMVALNHNPDAVDRQGWDRFRGWVLAGHTHGGQVRPPFFSPPLLPLQNKLYAAGEFALSGDRRLYVSRGVGHRLQLRFNVRPEVTVFELRPA